MTADERKAAFMADFKALLRKHDAEFSVYEYMHEEDKYAIAEVALAQRFEAGRCVDEGVSFDLPRFENGKE